MNVPTAALETVRAPEAYEIQRLERERMVFRHTQANRLLKFFYAVNLAVFCFIVAAWLVQTWVAPSAACDMRMVNDRTILALIAGSVAQLGVVAAAVGKGLFQSE